ncbi:nuclear protein [Hysterangium stoloniferum]|nr:nuclear protein [Hysterangium stoloniferum]
MAPTRTRSPSPDASNKRMKADHTLSEESNVDLCFTSGLLANANALKLNGSYHQALPYKYCVLDQLFDDELLRKVKDECVGELSFTEKSTDIYRVHQTGDLASLSYLPKEELQLLPSLLRLRDALYSPQFRSFLRTVTGCGPLSGSKQDMSVNSYKTGCHLLNHDDVIGSRCVSYILYMPLPCDQKWDKAWGGALELYPVTENNEPQSIPSRKISPAWNQFIFFEVQPGRSFHSVEEVVVGGGSDPRDRLSISGWFHKAQEGEEGYEPELTDRKKSSLEQLSTAEPRPLTPYPIDDEPPIPPIITEAQISFLSDYLDQVYLSPKNISMLASRFASECSLELHSFLRMDLATQLEAGLRGLDTKDQLGTSRKQRIPSHTSGISESSWYCKGPPHKQRYCIIGEKESSDETHILLRRLQDELFPSAAFRTWLALLSGVVPMQYAVEARRFRPGLDYTLATAEKGDSRLDVVLGLTPEVEVKGKGKGKAEANWESGEWGGWECYLPAREEDDDPAVYGSGRKKNPNHAADAINGDGTDGDSEDEDDSTLLTVQPGFNRLLVVLRDPDVLHFVKYVSAMAPGSRWDICGEWEVGQVEVEEEEDEDEAVAENGELECASEGIEDDERSDDE